MIRLFVALTIAIAIIATAYIPTCLAGQISWPAKYKDQVTTRVYQEKPDVVSNAVISCLEASGYPIITNNKTNGIIITDYVSSPEKFSGKGQLRFEMLITKVDERTTKVRATIKCQTYSQVAGTINQDNMVDEYDYQDFFNALYQQINNDNPQEPKQGGSPYSFRSPNPSYPSVYNTDY